MTNPDEFNTELDHIAITICRHLFNAHAQPHTHVYALQAKLARGLLALHTETGQNIGALFEQAEQLDRHAPG